MADEELQVHDVDDASTTPALPPSDGPRKYACKLCRHVVFTSEELLDHAPQQQQIAMRKVRLWTLHSGVDQRGLAGWLTCELTSRALPGIIPSRR